MQEHDPKPLQVLKSSDITQAEMPSPGAAAVAYITWVCCSSAAGKYAGDTHAHHTHHMYLSCNSVAMATHLSKYMSMCA